MKLNYRCSCQHERGIQDTLRCYKLKKSNVTMPFILLVLLLLNLETTIASSTCMPGRYHSDNLQFYVCNLCPKGKYGNKAGAVAEAEACPSLCPPGKYGDVEGAVNENISCTFNCPVGKFGNISGGQNESSACINCPLGKHSSHEGGTSDLCRSCKSGSYKSHFGTTACINCPFGKFGNTTGGISEDKACMDCSKWEGPIVHANTSSCCPLNLVLSSDIGCVNADKDFCEQMAISFLSINFSHPSMGQRCNGPCRSVNLLRHNVTTIWYLNYIDMFICITGLIWFIGPLLFYRKPSLEFKLFMAILALADVVIQITVLFYSFDANNAADPLLKAQCTNKLTGTKHHETLVRLSENLQTTTLLGFIELFMIVVEVVGLIYDVIKDSGSPCGLCILCTAQFADAALAVFDFVVYTDQAYVETQTFFSSYATLSSTFTTLYANKTTPTMINGTSYNITTKHGTDVPTLAKFVNTGEWCVDISEVSTSCLSANANNNEIGIDMGIAYGIPIVIVTFCLICCCFMGVEPKAPKLCFRKKYSLNRQDSKGSFFGIEIPKV